MITIAVLFILALAGVKWAADMINRPKDRIQKLLDRARRIKKPPRK